MGLPGGIIGALAQQSVGQGGGDSREAVAALARGIAALHSYLDLVQDPKNRATVTQCLARLESIRGNHMPDQANQGQGGPPAQGQNQGY